MVSIEKNTKKRRYSSDEMEARRQRILKAVRAFLRKGNTEFSMRALARDSGVALGTLYNQFGGRDALIAQAIKDVYISRLNVDEAMFDGDILEQVHQRQIRVAAEILRRPNFAKYMEQIYFGPESSIRTLIHTYSLQGKISLIDRIESGGHLQDWVAKEALAENLALAQHSVIAKWAVGEILNHQIAARLEQFALSLLVGAVSDPLLDRIRTRLIELSAD